METQENNKKISKFFGIITMVCSMLGSGALFLPNAFMILDYFYGITAFVVVAVFNYLTLYFLGHLAVKQLNDELPKNNKDKLTTLSNDGVDCKFETNESDENRCSVTISPIAAKKEDLNYYSIAKKYLGPYAKIVDFFIVLQSVGSCLIYVKVLQTILGKLFNFENRIFTSILFTLPLYLLSLLKDLKSLKYVTYLSVFSVGFLMVLLVLLSSLFDQNEMSKQIGNFDGEKITKDGIVVIKAMSTMVFALSCHQNILNIFNRLKNKNLKEISIVSFWTIICGSIVYLTIGIAGFYFGRGLVSSDILSIFNKNDNLSDGKIDIITFIEEKSEVLFYATFCARFLFSGVLLCAFILQMYPAKDSCLRLFKKHAFKISLFKENPDYFKYFMTTVFCIIICGIAMIDINPGKIVDLIAATATNGIVFIIPSILLYLSERKINYKTILSFIIGISGVLSMLLMIYKTISELISAPIYTTNHAGG